MYATIVSRALRRLPAETAHRLGFWLIRAAAAMPGGAVALRRWLGPRDPALRLRALGVDLPGPLGLAAGFDKSARGPDALAAVGFAFVEVGTVTAAPQPGNPRPRVFRLSRDRALINRMGFNNDGAAAVAARLRARREPPRRPRRGSRAGVAVGANIGRTRRVPGAGAVADYVASASLLAGQADYLVVNVSSPNTPGLRGLQSVSRLRPLLSAVRRAMDASGGERTALMVKISPDLADEEVDAVADLALDLGIDGIVATNTTTSRDHVASPAAEVGAAGAGGLSGPPLRPRALSVLRRLRRRAGDRLVLVASGGIDSADDAWERILAGATLVQGYTGFVYGGPLWPRRVHASLARRVREAGFASIRDAVGAAADHPGPAAPGRGGERRGGPGPA